MRRCGTLATHFLQLARYSGSNKEKVLVPKTIQKAETTSSKLNGIELCLETKAGQGLSRMDDDKLITLAGSKVVHEVSEGKMSK